MDMTNRIVEFSTEELPEQDRIAVWREHYGQIMLRADLEPARDEDFHVCVRSFALPGLQLMHASSSPVKISRAGRYLADGNDDILLAVNRAGPVLFGSSRREETLRQGEAIVLSGGDAFSYHRAGAGHSLTLRVPRASFESTVIDIDDALMRPIPADNGALKLVSDYAGWLLNAPAPVDPQLLNLTVRHIHDLMALALGPSADFADTARTRGLRAARLKVARSFIAANSQRRDISISTVAAHLSVTPRYVQRLFEADSTTFSEFLIGQRLARAHRLLCEPNANQIAISTIAYDVGFGDLSYFNRRFRRQYGLTPREVRGDRA